MKNFLNNITSILRKITIVYKEKLPHIVFLVLLFVFFVLIRQLPYINIFPHYYYYVLLIYLVIITYFLKKQLSSRILFILLTILLTVGFIAELLSLSEVALFSGFAIYIFVLLGAFVEFIVNRKQLRDFE